MRKAPEPFEPLGAHAEILVSNVDKKRRVGEREVRLCNYMDVYSTPYLDGRRDYMVATANPAEIHRFLLRSGDVVVTKDSETPDDIGIAAVIDDVDGPLPLVCGYHLAILRPRIVDSVFLAKQLVHDRIKAYFRSRATGTTRYGLSNGALAGVPLFTPPQREQERIGQILRALDDASRSTEQLIAKLENVKRGLLHDLLTRGIDDNGGIRDPERHPEQFKESTVGQIPGHWKVAPLGCWMEANPQNGLYKPASAYGERGTPIVRIDSFYDGEIVSPRTLKRLRLTRGELDTYRIEAGDVLINRVNSIEFVGKVALVPSLPEPTVFESNIMRVRVTSGTLHPQFATMWLCSPLARRHFYRRAKSAIMQASVNQGDVRSVPLVVPPMAEQAAIIRIVTMMHSRLAEERRALDKLRLLKKGLADDLLTGRVCVVLPAEHAS